MAKKLRKWVKLLAGGDQSAFVPFYEQTAPGLLRFLLWKTKGDRPLSEDILQEAYVRFLTNLDKIDAVEEVAIYSYLLRIAKNCLIDKTARSPRAKREHVDADSVVLVDNHQTARQERAIELRELAVAMDSLNEKDSEIIWLRDAMGFSHREVAQEVGITEQASRQAYLRAKRSLMEVLAPAILPSGGAYATP